MTSGLDINQAVLIKDVCIGVFKREEVSRVQAISIQVILKLLQLNLPHVDAVSFNVTEMAEMHAVHRLFSLLFTFNSFANEFRVSKASQTGTATSLTSIFSLG